MFELTTPMRLVCTHPQVQPAACYATASIICATAGVHQIVHHILAWIFSQKNILVIFFLIQNLTKIHYSRTLSYSVSAYFHNGLSVKFLRISHDRRSRKKFSLHYGSLQASAMLVQTDGKATRWIKNGLIDFKACTIFINSFHYFNFSLSRPVDIPAWSLDPLTDTLLHKRCDISTIFLVLWMTLLTLNSYINLLLNLHTHKSNAYNWRLRTLHSATRCL